MNKPPIVILHGWGLSAEKFSPLGNVLHKKGYTVYLPDLPGFGTEKEPEKPWDLTDYVNFVQTYLVKHNIHKPVVIGHSFGGRVALQLSLQYPQSLRAIVLSGTPGFSPVPKGKMVFFALIAKIGRAFFLLPVLTNMKINVRSLLYRFAGVSDYNRATPVMKETFKKIVQQPLLEAMQKLSIPSLLLWGEHDQICPVSVAKRMEHAIPNTKLIIIGDANHKVPYANPIVFADHVERFIKESVT